MLKIENIEAGYNGKSIIKNINFSTKPGQLMGLLGLNGAGKTTLLKVISGLLKPISGKCCFNNRDIYKLREKERARLISFLPQRSSIIYNTRVIDVVLMGITPYLGVFESPTKYHSKLAHDTLKFVSMEDYSEENFLHLSEGQKQLIIIARNLLQNSKVMLFDEPDSSLDYPNKHMVLGMIKKIVNQNEKGGIITLHDPNLALSYCDNIIILNGGGVFNQFKVSEVDRDKIFSSFSHIYGKIDVVQYNNKYIIVR